MPKSLSYILAAAGIYNLVFGVIAIVAPTATFVWLGVEPPRYPELWQCIGMIVGVYGVGYLIAATNPARHWCIVLVGLLGKVFGPIGVAWSVAGGRLPASFFWVTLFNDLIWWIPFVAILLYAFREYATVEVPEEIADENGHLPSETLLSQDGETLAEISQDEPTMVVFLRHSGCTFHREALSDLVVARPTLAELGVRLAIVHMGEQLKTGAPGGDCPLTDVARFSDPDRRLYREFGLGHGTFNQLLGPAVWKRGFQSCVIDGTGVGPLDGDGFQMPGVFVVHAGKRLVSYRHKHAGDRPDYAAIAREGAELAHQAGDVELAR
jgi:hypothetical protein